MRWRHDNAHVISGAVGSLRGEIDYRGAGSKPPQRGSTGYVASVAPGPSSGHSCADRQQVRSYSLHATEL